MRFAIIIPTYRRKDGKTPEYLGRCIASILSQTYKDYKLFIVGDRYEEDAEILPLIPKGAWYYNLDHVPEREIYSGMRLWNIAGTKASIFAFNEAIKQGYRYLISLDHDDYLAPNHLQELYLNLPFAWACTRSTYKNKSLPRIDTREYVTDFLPRPAGVVHSSVCYDYSQIPLLTRNVYEETGRDYPGDADLWARMADYVQKNKLRSIFINKLTCFKYSEGYAREEFL